MPEVVAVSPLGQPPRTADLFQGQTIEFPYGGPTKENVSCSDLCSLDANSVPSHTIVKCYWRYAVYHAHTYSMVMYIHRHIADNAPAKRLCHFFSLDFWTTDDHPQLQAYAKARVLHPTTD